MNIHRLEGRRRTTLLTAAILTVLGLFAIVLSLAVFSEVAAGALICSVGAVLLGGALRFAYEYIDALANLNAAQAEQYDKQKRAFADRWNLFYGGQEGTLYISGDPEPIQLGNDTLRQKKQLHAEQHGDWDQKLKALPSAPPVLGPQLPEKITATNEVARIINPDGTHQSFHSWQWHPERHFMTRDEYMQWLRE